MATEVQFYQAVINGLMICPVIFSQGPLGRCFYRDGIVYEKCFGWVEISINVCLECFLKEMKKKVGEV